MLDVFCCDKKKTIKKKKKKNTKKDMFEYVKQVLQFSIIARKSNRKKVNGQEDITERFVARLF